MSVSKETFINKYKPYFLDDFYMNDKQKIMIKNLIEMNEMNALFVGSPGTGKTTVLQSIIREYFGLSKKSTFPENNILFINNLKEQGINYYRNEMKTFCQSQSSIYGKKKLIIIDDLDTVNEHSQQVFRNYIDKYSKNIMFVSVCTNMQKVIESIQSRVHIFKLRTLTYHEISTIMNQIITEENIQIDEESKQYLLTISSSLRVLINYLEKIYIYGKTINIDVCKTMCSSIHYSTFEKYVENIKEKKLQDAIQIMYHLHDHGYSVIDILDYFFSFVKMTTCLNEEIKYKLISYICKYITIFNNIHEDVIELSFFTNNIMSLFDNISI
jgi:DNA polymerase III subunit gamma/tau